VFPVKFPMNRAYLFWYLKVDDVIFKCAFKCNQEDADDEVKLQGINVNKKSFYPLIIFVQNFI